MQTNTNSIRIFLRTVCTVSMHTQAHPHAHNHAHFPFVLLLFIFEFGALRSPSVFVYLELGWEHSRCLLLWCPHSHTQASHNSGGYIISSRKPREHGKKKLFQKENSNGCYQWQWKFSYFDNSMHADCIFWFGEIAPMAHCLDVRYSVKFIFSVTFPAY